MTAHRSRLTKLQAESERIATLNAKLESNIATFSAIPVPFGSGAAYHAAQTTRFRQFAGDAWGNRPQHEDVLLRPYDRGIIISRTRIMIRNNPWLYAIFLAYVQEIGVPTYKSTADLGDIKKSKAYNDKRERLFAKWAKDCESDDDLSLDEVVTIWGFEWAIAGELYIAKQRTGELQLIPSELCGSAKIGTDHLAGATFNDGTPLPPGTREENGKLRLGRKLVGYRFGSRDAKTGAVSFADDKSTLVSKNFVHHLYDRDRIEQSSGIPHACTVLAKFQDIYETNDARSQQVKNAACLSMWITKNMDPYGFTEAIKGSLRTGNIVDATALKTLAEKRSAYTDLRAGAIYIGETNEDIKLIEPRLNAADWIDHNIGLLQVCCAVLDGMPVEVGIEGYRRSNYSSARATNNKWKRNVIARRATREKKFLDPIQLWQTGRFERFGDLPSIPDDQREECYWGWPAIPDIDGTKTAAMNAIKLNNGSTNLRRVYIEEGLHYEIEIKQIATEKIDFVLELAAQAETRLQLPKDKAIAWAMTAAPNSDNPALAAILADAFKSEDAPPDPKPAKGKKPAPPEE